MCAIILICTSAIGVNIYKNSLRKLKLLEAFRNMFFVFNAYITIEHCEIRECIRRYILKNDDAGPILENVLHIMEENKRINFAGAMKNALDTFTEKNSGLLEGRDKELIVHTCGEIDGLRRGYISEFMNKTCELLDKRIQECRDKDVKNGKVYNKVGVLIGIAIIILII
jgi:stage III sporulation protein AB